MFEPKCSGFTFFRLTFRLHKLFLCCASQLLCLQITTLLIKITSHLLSYFYVYKLLTKLQVTYKVISYFKKLQVTYKWSLHFKKLWDTSRVQTHHTLYQRRNFVGSNPDQVAKTCGKKKPGTETWNPLLKQMSWPETSPSVKNGHLAVQLPGQAWDKKNLMAKIWPAIRT